MKRNMHNKLMALILVMAIICSTLILTGCKKDNTPEYILTLVRGTLEASYSGEPGEDYIERTGMTTDQIQAQYDLTIMDEAIQFVYYIGLTETATEQEYLALPEKTRSDIESMYREVYKQAKYEVRDPEQDDPNNYSVEVVIEPIDVMETVMATIASGYETYDKFTEKYNTGQIREEDFSSEMVKIIKDLVLEKLPESGYKESKTLVLNISRTAEDQPFTIDPAGWKEIHKTMIYYP